VILLDRLVDDAGLFPPTSLSMPDALARHRAVSSPMLSGRFLVPGDRLDELCTLLDGPIDVHVIGPGATVDERICVRAREGREISEMPCYVEGVRPRDLHGAYGKLRCAGAAVEDVAGYVTEAVAAGVPFKATAGMHAAVCGWDGPDNHGYLNLLLAVGRALTGGDVAEIVACTDADLLVQEAKEADAPAIRELFHSYGSCDTVRPVDDARKLGLI
jgi:hypothetical protein